MLFFVPVLGLIKELPVSGRIFKIVLFTIAAKFMRRLRLASIHWPGIYSHYAQLRFPECSYCNTKIPGAQEKF